MKISVYLAVGAAFVVCTALAAQIDIPHQFTSGTPARSAEVNANFAALSEESNTQDTRLTAIEGFSRRPSAQLLCVLPYGLGGDGGAGAGHTTLACVRDSSPGAPERLTYADIVAEEWVAVSGGSHEVVMIFNQYEAT